jgi:two-component system response regulator RegX3
MMTPRVLLVEDEPVTRTVIEAWLLSDGYAVQSAATGEEALRLLAIGAYALLVTDICLGAMDGIDLLVRARAIDPDLDVIVLTGSATLDSAIAAVNHGACAYLRKPVARGELQRQARAAVERRQARTERAALLRQVSAALLRIAEPAGAGYDPAADGRPLLRVRDMEIDLGRRRVCVGGQAVALSNGQFDLLVYLARNADAVQSHEQLAREVLGYHCRPDEARELIKASIHRLRSKIEADPSAPSYLVSVRGAGYMLASGV